MFDQQKLTRNMQLSESIVQRLFQVPNEEKFTIARTILTKTNDQMYKILYTHLKEVIIQSYQPHELYTHKIFKLTCWRGWMNNVQINSQGGYYQTTPDDVHRLFECYDLPQSLEHYTNLNKNIYKYYELDPARRYTRSRPVSNEEIDELIQKLQELRCTLYESLKQELLDNYGIIITAEPIKSEFNGTFKAHLALGAQAEEKLRAYIDRQLALK